MEARIALSGGSRRVVRGSEKAQRSQRESAAQISDIDISNAFCALVEGDNVARQKRSTGLGLVADDLAYVPDSLRLLVSRLL